MTRSARVSGAMPRKPRGAACARSLGGCGGPRASIDWSIKSKNSCSGGAGFGVFSPCLKRHHVAAARFLDKVKFWVRRSLSVTNQSHSHQPVLAAPFLRMTSLQTFLRPGLSLLAPPPSLPSLCLTLHPKANGIKRKLCTLRELPNFACTEGNDWRRT